MFKATGATLFGNRADVFGVQCKQQIAHLENIISLRKTDLLYLSGRQVGLTYIDLLAFLTPLDISSRKICIKVFTERS